MLRDYIEKGSGAGSNRNEGPVPLGDVNEVIDLEQFQCRIGGDQELMTEIVELFLDESSRLAEAIRQAIGANSSVDLRSAAHALKGSVANFSAPRVYQAATRLESMGAEGRLSGAMEAWFNLQDELAMLAAVLMRLRRNSPTL